MVGSAAIVGADPGVASVVTASKGPATVAVAVVVARLCILLCALDLDFGLPSTNPFEL